MTNTLPEIASTLFDGPGERSKSILCYNIYETFFQPFRNKEISLFEVGVFNGESTKIFAKYFCNAQIVGIDHDLRAIDLNGYRNINLFQGDQSSYEFMAGVADEYFGNGIDIVIDDASHIGILSKRTFEILFPRLKSGGIYIVEDWGTGYWTNWHDGGLYEIYETRPFHKGEFVKRIPSHDYGMVGFIKHVVDLVGMSDNRPTSQSEQKQSSPIKGMHIFPGTVVIEKA